MILLCLVSWLLLTACGEYVLHQASFAKPWRERRVVAKGWWSRMIGCFACPWGWSSLVAGTWIGFVVWIYTLNPWATIPLALVSLPWLGLGLSRLVYWLSPMIKSVKGE